MRLEALLGSVCELGFGVVELELPLQGVRLQATELCGGLEHSWLKTTGCASMC